MGAATPPLAASFGLPLPHAGTASRTVSPTERSLVEKAQRGDRAAFAALVEMHQRAVYGFLRARLLVAADAEDLCQEVFLRCYLGREKFERAKDVRPWLFGIARNLLREHARRIARRKEVAWTEICLELDELIKTSAEPQEDALAHLPACLDSLGKSAREALDLRYQARLRFAEIGEKLCRSEGAVKLLVHRARLALRYCLDSKLAQGTA